MARLLQVAILLSAILAIPFRTAWAQTLSGSVHIQDVGDRPLSDGNWAGTKGQNRRLEGFVLNDPGSGLTLKYMCHIQGLGDSAWMSTGEFCGTKGAALRLEGFTIRLEGAKAANYSLDYQCHVQDIGDSQVMHAGDFCGTRGRSLRVEAIRLSLIPRSSSASGLSDSRHGVGTPSQPSPTPQATASLKAPCLDEYPKQTKDEAFSNLIRGKNLLAISGDGPFGTSLGHTEEALRLFCRAAASGNAEAAYEIGEALFKPHTINTAQPNGAYTSTSVPADREAAFRWYVIAAAGGNTKAMVTVAQYYGLGDQVWHGSGVQRDEQKAMIWLTAAANQNDTEAQLALTLAYADMVPASAYRIVAPHPDRSIAKTWAQRLLATLEKHSADCTWPNTVETMMALIPGEDERISDGAYITAVRGADEIDCRLALVAVPFEKNDTFLQRLQKLREGDATDSWDFKLLMAPDGKHMDVRRQTMIEKFVQDLTNMELLYEALGLVRAPAKVPLSETPKRPGELVHQPK